MSTTARAAAQEMQLQREENSKGSCAVDVGKGSIDETGVQLEKPPVTSANGKDAIPCSAFPRQSHNSRLGMKVTWTLLSLMRPQLARRQDGSLISN